MDHEYDEPRPSAFPALQAVKFDSAKPKLSLIPSEVIMALGRTLTYGAGKYGERNWEKGMDWSRAYSALQRHLTAWNGGQDMDDESGLSHLDHALCNLAFLVAYRDRKVGKDDRK